MTHIYTLTHPELSEPLILESDGKHEHTDTFLANNAWHYLRTFDQMIDRHGFTITRTES